MPASRQVRRTKQRPPIHTFDNSMALIQGRAAHDDRLSIGALRQLIVLSLLSAGQSIIETPRIGYLAEATNRSKRSATKDFALLISCGYIERQRVNYQRSWLHLLTPGE
jgi:hypothetical protein